LPAPITQTHFSHGSIDPITPLTHPKSARISVPSAETAVAHEAIAPPTLVTHGIQVMTSGITFGSLTTSLTPSVTAFPA
jgi:hypothetical protein